MTSLSKFSRVSATVGSVVWLLLLPTTTSDARETELIHRVVFFGMLVIVPLGLSLVRTVDEPESLWHRLAVLVQPFAVLPAIGSFFLKTGPLAAALASVWLILAVLVALLGLTRFKARGLFPVEESSIDAGLIYLTVAGMWLVVYRLGVQPFEYGETIILLTVVHFHFAGFAAPIIAGMSGRVLATRKHPQTMFRISVLALVAAMPLVAAGITFSPWLGFIGTLILSTGLLLLAVLTIGWVIRAIKPSSSRVLLVFGALCTCAAMLLACLYAFSLATKTLIITIPTMALTHGFLNAFGFVTCSLLAWTDSSPKNKTA